MTSNLSQFQEAFVQALFLTDANPLPETMQQPGIAVYRNTVIKGCIDALRSNYPTVARLVGEAWFDEAAASFVRQTPPHDPRLLYYGERFAHFLALFEPAKELTYLPDVARFDWLWGECHAALDATVLEPATLAALAPEVLYGCALQLHPATRWACCAEQPIYTIWERNRTESDDAAEIEWRGEGILLTRPQAAVEWHRLSAAGCAFLEACKLGRPLDEAADEAYRMQADIDLASLWSSLLTAGAFAGVVQPNLSAGAQTKS